MSENAECSKCAGCGAEETYRDDFFIDYRCKSTLYRDSDSLDRSHTCRGLELLDVPGVLTYFTGGAPKQWFMEQRGVSVDVWIDNEPRVILYGR